MRKKIKLIEIKKSSNKSKKWRAVFEIEKDGKISTKTTDFGQRGAEDYTIHKTLARRNRYIDRHMKDVATNDPIRAGYLSLYILWNYPSFNGSLRDYKRRLGIYNRTGKFPTNISKYTKDWRSKGKKTLKSKSRRKVRKSSRRTSRRKTSRK